MKKIVLVVKAPPCAWLGTGRKALIADGATHEHTFDLNGRLLNGVFCALRVGPVEDACEFFCKGDLRAGACQLFRDKDRRQWLEPDHDRREPGTDIHLWGCVEYADWAKAYVLNADMTISPNTNNPHNVCLGVHNDGGQAKVIFVLRTDARRRLVFGGPAEMQLVHEELREERAQQDALRQVMESEARAVLTPDFCRRLRDEGWARLKGIVPMDVIGTARAEINRLLGQSYAGEFKGFMPSSHPAIAALVKASAIPVVLSELLGGDPEWYRARAAQGQIALRFPGDNCPDGAPLGPTGRISQAHFDGARKGWHIDGCASDAIPGVTDHYGTIHNFDVLVGVLLSDVAKPMSGELVLYPGSHTCLAAYFRQTAGVLEKLRTEGGTHLPTGDRTDELFHHRQAEHCTGRAGDVIIANYLTAHLIAPNLSPDIRYCVYFRMSGPRFESDKAAAGGNVHSMVSPWRDWEGLTRRCGGAVGPTDAETADAIAAVAALGRSAPTRTRTREDEQRNAERQQQLARADYSPLQREHSRQVARNGGGMGGASLEVAQSLASMFPSVGEATIADVLASCDGNADAAVEHLLEMGG